MFHLALQIEHQQQGDDGKLATGTRREVANATTGIVLDGRNKLAHIATRHSLACLGVHLAGIGIRRIMGEVAADDKEILIRKPGLQHLGDTFQLGEVVGGDDDRDRRRDRRRSEKSLEEGQLDFEAVLTIVGLRTIGENAVSSHQLLGCLAIHLYLAQGGGIIVHLAVHRGAIEPLVMAGTQEEDALIGLLGVESGVGRGCHIA